MSKNYGFIRVAAAIPFNKVADIDHNTEEILKLIKEASYKGASVIVFPELTLTTYSCADLFFNSVLLKKSIDSLLYLAEKTKKYNIISFIGLPIINQDKLYNCAAALCNGKILGLVPKSFLPGYREFYEPRWFNGIETDTPDYINISKEKIPFGRDILFINKNIENLTIGVEICEDLWMPIPPSSYQAIAGATILCNLSASNVLVTKNEYRRELIKNQSSRCFAAYIYSSTGVGESTTDLVFDSDAIIAENGEIVAESKRFLRESQLIYADIDLERLIKERIIQKNIKNSTKQFRFIEFSAEEIKFKIEKKINQTPFVPQQKDKLKERCLEIINIQSTALAKRIESCLNSKAIIGVSGGLDSTLALLITVNCFDILKKDRKEIIAVTMPGFGTTDFTYNNVTKLCRKLNVTILEKPIKDLSMSVFKTVEHSPDIHDVVYENIQARARTYILMTVANQTNGIVVGTGDLSEIALGWSTYNGDHISMYNVNSSIPKTLVKFLIKEISDMQSDEELKNILRLILEQPISPELLPPDKGKISQKTEDIIGPYELHDFFLYYLIRFGFGPKKILFLAELAFKNKYDKDTLMKWLKVFLKRFINNQWKRDCVPAGPKVGSIDLSPRGSWRMPSETELKTFLEELN